MLNSEMIKAARMLEQEREKELVDETNRRKFLEKYFRLGKGVTNEEKFGGFLVENAEEKLAPPFSPTLEEELGLLLPELNFQFHIFWKVIKAYIAIEEDLNYVQKKKAPFYVEEMTGKYYWVFEDIYNKYQIVKTLLRFLRETLGEIYDNNFSGEIITENVRWKYPQLTPIIFGGFGVKQRLDFVNENLCDEYNSMLQIAFELCTNENLDKNCNYIKEFLSEFEKISERLDRMMNALNKQILQKWFLVDKVTSIKELITDILNDDTEDNTNEKNSLMQFIYSGVIIFLLHFFFHNFCQISNGFENVWFGDLLDVIEGINNDIYFTIVTLTFTILSLTSVLSTKTNEVYWVDAVELKLMHPRWFNFTSLAAGLIIDLIFATCCRLGNIIYLLFMSYFIAISLLIILTYRMIDVYFGKGKTKKRLKRQFLIDKELGETRRNRYKYNLNKLKVRTKQHIENLDEIYIVENLQLLLDAKEIKAVNDLLIYIKNNAPDIFHDIFQSLKIGDYNEHLSVVYDVFREQIDSQHSNPAIIEFCVEFIGESFLEEVRKMITSSAITFRKTYKAIYSNKDMLNPFVNEYYILDNIEDMKMLEKSIVEHNNIFEVIKQRAFLYKAVKEKNAFNYRTDAVRLSIENNRWDILALFSEAYGKVLKDENWLQIPGGENDIVQLIVNIVLGRTVLGLIQSAEVYGKDVVLRKNRCIEVIEEGLREYAFLERDLRAMLGFIKNLDIDRDKEITIIEECMKAGYDIFEVYDIVDMNACREYQHCWVIPYGTDVEDLKSADLAYLTGEPLYEEGKLVEVPHQKIANPYAC